MKLVLLCLFFTGQVFAQSYTQGTSNSDLRGQKEIFSIKWEASEYKLEASQNGQYKLYFFKKGELGNSWKIDKDKAEDLDIKFADKFIAMKYEMKAAMKMCKTGTKLRMHGEKQTVCPNEDEKQNIVKKFISDLESNIVKG